MVGRVRLAVAAGVAALVAPVALAQPDFARTFEKLDTDKDGVISFGELRHEDVDAARYAAPIGSYVTDDGYSVELWETPFGIREVSMPDELLQSKAHRLSGTFPQDVPVQVSPALMLAANPELRTMTLGRFENELREYVQKRFEGLDENRDGRVSEADLDRMFLALVDFHQKKPGFQTGPGGEAMRAHSQLLKLRFYQSLDLDDDEMITREEMLEAILNRMVAAYAPRPK